MPKSSYHYSATNASTCTGQVLGAAERISRETLATFGIRIALHGDANRWHIPVHDESGKHVGVIVKNLNTFDQSYRGTAPKDDVVFNLNRVLVWGTKATTLTLTEDIYDCISLWDAGERYVVSFVGSRLSKVQCDLLINHFAPGQIRLVLSRNRRDVTGARLATINRLSAKTYVRKLWFHKG